MTNCLGNNHRHTWRNLTELLSSILPLYADSVGDEVFKSFLHQYKYHTKERDLLGTAEQTSWHTSIQTGAVSEKLSLIFVFKNKMGPWRESKS